MRRYKNKQAAIEYAADMDLTFGMSVFDGRFYVGSTQQIEDIGCVDISFPHVAADSPAQYTRVREATS